MHFFKRKNQRSETTGSHKQPPKFLTERFRSCSNPEKTRSTVEIEIKRGILIKEGGRIKSWKTRMFRLTTTKLEYYKMQNNVRKKND